MYRRFSLKVFNFKQFLELYYLYLIDIGTAIRFATAAVGKAAIRPHDLLAILSYFGPLLCLHRRRL